MHRSIKILFVCLSVMLSITMLTVVSRAESNPIRKTDPAAFDQLIKNAPRPLIVAMMASWCAPCIKELPTLNLLYKRYRSQGLDMVGVSLDFGGTGAMQLIIDSYKVKFPVYWLGEAGARAYNINSIPLLWIVKKGVITEKILGNRPIFFLEKKINNLIRKN